MKLTNTAVNLACFSVTGVLLLFATDTQAQDNKDDERIKALEERIKLIQQELNALQKAKAWNEEKTEDDPFGNALKRKSGINFNLYGESKYNMTGGSKGNYFDTNRFVLMQYYKLNDLNFIK